MSEAPIPAGDDQRLFVALPVDARLVEPLVALQCALDRRLPRRSVRWVRQAQLHLTLQFLGDVAAAEVPALIEQLREACRDGTRLQLELRGVGVFPHQRRPRVVWVGVAGDVAALTTLQERIATACAPYVERPESRAFAPHLTLGRVNTQDPREARAVGEAVTAAGIGELGVWPAHSVKLIRSQLRPQGPRYTELAAFALRPDSAD